MIRVNRQLLRPLLLLLLLLYSTYYLVNWALLPTTHNTKPYQKVKCELLIMILSTPANVYNRDVLRKKSYLAYRWKYNDTLVDYQYIFVLGDSGQGDVNLNVRTEAQFYGDIAVGHFRDSYETLTDKVIWGFGYALQRYDFKYCIKVDEDSFINVKYLARYLSTVNPGKLPLFYAGKPRQGTLKIPHHGKFKVERNWENGTIDEYVQYNLGGGYIVSAQLMTSLLAVHQAGVIEPVMWEDVYIGFLAYLAGAPPVRIYHYYVSKPFPFCTDDKSILLHHTLPELQARILSYYHTNGIYCPKNMTENAVMQLLDGYEIVDWVKYFSSG